MIKLGKAYLTHIERMPVNPRPLSRFYSGADHAWRNEIRPWVCSSERR